MLGNQIGGCTEATLRIYRAWLVRLQAQAGDPASVLDGAAISRFFASLRKRGLSASSVHQAYRTLKTFCRWLVATGALSRNPMVDVSMADADHVAPGTHRR